MLEILSNRVSCIFPYLSKSINQQETSQMFLIIPATFRKNLLQSWWIYLIQVTSHIIGFFPLLLPIFRLSKPLLTLIISSGNWKNEFQLETLSSIFKGVIASSLPFWQIVIQSSFNFEAGDRGFEASFLS